MITDQNRFSTMPVTIVNDKFYLNFYFFIDQFLGSISATLSCLVFPPREEWQVFISFLEWKEIHRDLAEANNFKVLKEKPRRLFIYV